MKEYSIDEIKRLVPEFDGWYGVNETDAILIMPGTRAGKIVDLVVFRALFETRATLATVNARLEVAVDVLERIKGWHEKTFETTYEDITFECAELATEALTKLKEME